MTAQYRFLDEVGISKQQNDRQYSSKWWFCGTRAELEDWLPDNGDDADFSNLDSSDPSLGNSWAPAGYKIKDCRATAIDRFEWDVVVSAENPIFKGNFTYPTDKNNLSGKEEVEVEKGSFTITEEMAGYKWMPELSDYEDLSLTGTSWSLETDCPFTVRPLKTQVNQNIPVSILMVIVFLSGAPDTHLADFNAFKGVQILKSQTGRVIQSKMIQVNDASGAVFTQWTKAIMMPPGGFTWNTNWKGI